MTTFKASLPDGNTDTRNSDREYTHAIIGFVHDKKRSSFDSTAKKHIDYIEPAHWAVVMWTSNPVNGLAKYRKSTWVSEVRAIETEIA